MMMKMINIHSQHYSPLDRVLVHQWFSSEPQLFPHHPLLMIPQKTPQKIPQRSQQGTPHSSQLSQLPFSTPLVDQSSLCCLSEILSHCSQEMRSHPQGNPQHSKTLFVFKAGIGIQYLNSLNLCPPSFVLFLKIF